MYRLTLGFWLLCNAAVIAQEKPNVLVIVGDDMRYDSFSILGNQVVQTPNIDRIAREGLIAENAYANYSLCSPSRASILTGQYAHTHGVINNKSDKGINTLKSMAQLLGQNGYYCGFIGKYHIKGQPAPQPGYDYWLSFSGSGDYINPKVNINGAVTDRQGHLTEILTNEALDFIRLRQVDKPFLLNLMYKSPKSPYNEYIPDLDTLKLEALLRLPGSFRSNLNDKPEFVKRNSENQLYTKDHVINSLQNYYRHILGLDHYVGEILNQLEQQNILDNTLIIFTSDHGFLQYEHDIFGKRFPYEPALRVPLFVRYPKWFSGQRTDKPVSLLDILPTVLDAAEAEPEELPGKSMKDIFTVDRKSHIIQYFQDKNFQLDIPSYRIIHENNWKYIRYFNSTERDELYDLNSDPQEFSNLTTSRPDMAEQLYTMMSLKLESINDHLPDLESDKSILTLHYGQEKNLTITNTGSETFVLDSIFTDGTNALSLDQMFNACIEPGSALTLNFYADNSTDAFTHTGFITLLDRFANIEMNIPFIIGKEQDEGLIIYPNPAGTETYVFNFAKEIRKLFIYDFNGRQYAEYDQFGESEVFRLNIEYLNPGQYILTAVTTDNAKIYGKLIKK